MCVCVGLGSVNKITGAWQTGAPLLSTWGLSRERSEPEFKERTKAT